jgi:hypothetical protein
MAMERKMSDSEHACVTITRDGDLTDELKVLGLLENKETELKCPDDGVLTFNNQDISEDADWIRDAYLKSDFKRMGFVLGQALDKASKQNNLFLF